METKLSLYNTLTRKKELFVPIHPNHVGLYVCGPTVYGDPHLGHARPAITFDLMFRYLSHLGYKVRYVRNITDVGHLENDADSGEDKIAKKARLEELEPMEVVQYYTNRYHQYMDMLNVKRPSIEPRASGHIEEQARFVQKILNKGLAYESNGSIYFDVETYNKSNNYGALSGRKIDELLETTRTLDGQLEKRRSVDFALWKKASPEHIMRWKVNFKIPAGKYPNGKYKKREITTEGFPGWHLECSAMGTKYLGEEFDIHGGGLDLLFPHHECEIAQNKAALGKDTVKYWMHNNMITVNGQKMGKSLGNFITLEEFFGGSHKALEKAYSPMTVRFFILQAQYRSTLDFSNSALQAAEISLKRLMDAYASIDKIKPSDKTEYDLAAFETACYEALNDDLNSPMVIAQLFDISKAINGAAAGQLTMTAVDIARAKQLFGLFAFDILGLTPSADAASGDQNQAFGGAIELLLKLRADAKANKDFALSDRIRNELQNLGFVIKDGKDGATWELK